MKIAKVVLYGNIVKIAEKLNLSLADAFMVEQYRDVDCVGIENRFLLDISWVFIDTSILKWYIIRTPLGVFALRISLTGFREACFLYVRKCAERHRRAFSEKNKCSLVFFGVLYHLCKNMSIHFVVCLG